MNKAPILRPEVVVGALIVNDEGKIFFMTSPKWPGIYTIPGGKVEFGETLVDAVKREMKEETGLSVRDVRFLGIQESIYNPEYHERRHFIFFDYVCRTNDDHVSLNEEGIDFLWATIEEAKALPLGTTVRALLNTYITNYMPASR